MKERLNNKVVKTKQNRWDAVKIDNNRIINLEARSNVKIDNNRIINLEARNNVKIDNNRIINLEARSNKIILFKQSASPCCDVRQTRRNENFTGQDFQESKLVNTELLSLASTHFLRDDNSSKQTHCFSPNLRFNA